AIKYQGGDQVIVCYFGDGGVWEAELHESMNLAALWKLPVIFLCENNRYAMGTSVERALAQTEIWKFGQTYGIPAEKVDGMDVLAVREAVSRAVARTRQQKIPALIEADTYRYRGHSMRDPHASPLAMVLRRASSFMCATISTSPVATSVATQVTSPEASKLGWKASPSSMSLLSE